MSKKTKIFLLVALVVLVGVAALLTLGPISDSDKNFALDDIDKVDKIFLSNKNNNNVLLDRKGTNWIVNGKRLGFTETINNMLLTTKRLKVKGPVPESSYNTIIAQLANNAVKVEFYGRGYVIDFLGLKLFPKEKKLKSFFVGTSTMDNLGTYMMIENARRPYVVYVPGYRGYLTPHYSPVESVWFSHEIFSSRLSQIDNVILVNNEHPGESFKVKKVDSRNFTLTSYPDNEVVAYDTVKMTDFLSSFENIRYEAALDTNMYDFLNVDSIINTTPAYKISLTDYEGVESFMQIYRIPLTQQQKDATPIGQEEKPYNLDNCYAWVQVPSIKNTHDGGDIEYTHFFVLAQYFVLDNIIRNLSYLQHH